MIDIKKIIIAIDFSKYSRPIAEFAATISERSGAEIVAVSVIETQMVESVERVFHGEGRDFSAKRFLSDETYRRTQALQELLEKSLPKHVPRRSVVRSGVPHSEIVQFTKEEQADLLVIAQKGTSDLVGHLLGTTAEKIFRHSPVTVLSVNGIS